MLKLTRFSAALIASSLIFAPAHAEESKAFVTVNGIAISQEIADAFAKEQLARGVADTPEFRSAIRDVMIRRAVLLGEARKQGVDKQPEVTNQIETTTQDILIRAFFENYLKANPVTDAELKQDYDEFVTRLGGTEYKVRHILVEQESEARAIIAKLGKGAKFADLAVDSKDPGSKDNGGDLDWRTPAAFVQPFGDALTKLKKGQYTKTPVQTEFGYHVIQLDDTRSLTPPPIDELKPQLTQRAIQKKVEKLVESLRAKADVK